jgi:hypothetical protein
MKRTVIVMLAFLLFSQTVGLSQKKEIDPQKTVMVSEDSTEYRLIIMDLGFDSWLATRPARDFYSNNYYRLKNRFYVSEWNFRYIASSNPDLYDNYIEYDPDTDYGIDINYRLYYYFRYFEERNHVNLLNSTK